MKGELALIAIAAGFLSWIWLDRPAADRTPPPERFLTENEHNPPLKRLGDSTPLKAGMVLWFHPDRSSFGRVLAVDGDMVLFIENGERQAPVWIHRTHFRNAWAPAYASGADARKTQSRRVTR